jgi:hypothetical protein
MAERQRANQENKANSSKKNTDSNKIPQELDSLTENLDLNFNLLAPEISSSTNEALLSSAGSDQQRAVLAMQLQRSHGNAYVQRLVSSNRVQAKLTVSQPDDPYEVEADAVAEKVISAAHSEVQRQSPEEEEELVQGKLVQRQPEEEEEPLQAKIIQREGPEEEEELVQGKLIQRQPEEEEEPLQAKLIQRESPEEEEELVQAKLIQRQPEEEEEPLQAKLIQRESPEEEEPLQAKLIQRKSPEEEEEIQTKQIQRQKNAEVDETLENRISSARGAGQPLSMSARSALEPGFGHDFSNVKVHTDVEANTLSRQLNARAFTTGSDIFFREGDYQPHSDEGRKLIAHELTHVVQQQAAPKIQREVRIEEVEDQVETPEFGDQLPGSPSSAGQQTQPPGAGSQTPGSPNAAEQHVTAPGTSGPVGQQVQAPRASSQAPGSSDAAEQHVTAPGTATQAPGTPNPPAQEPAALSRNEALGIWINDVIIPVTRAQTILSGHGRAADKARQASENVTAAKNAVFGRLAPAYRSNSEATARIFHVHGYLQTMMVGLDAIAGSGLSVDDIRGMLDPTQAPFADFQNHL